MNTKIAANKNHNDRIKMILTNQGDKKTAPHIFLQNNKKDVRKIQRFSECKYL